MKYELIRSVDDIDTKKISIRDINKRYIDPLGNRYATRFNMITRKVEIVRVVSSRNEAIELRRQIIAEKKQSREVIPPKEPPSFDTIEKMDLESDNFAAAQSSFLVASDESGRIGNNGYSNEETDFYDPYQDDFHYVKPLEYEEDTFEPSSQKGIDKSIFIEGQFLEETYGDLVKTRDRLHALVNIFKKSRLFDLYKTDSVFDIIRILDGDCRNSVENAINLYKEISMYPRPLTYYLSRMHDERKSEIDALDNDDKKMELIKRWELQDSFETVYSKLLSVHANLIRILDEIPEHIYESMNSSQKTQIDNARSSCQYMIDESNRMLTRISIWKKAT